MKKISPYDLAKIDHVYEKNNMQIRALQGRGDFLR